MDQANQKKLGNYKILLCGGNGFIGKNLSRLLAEQAEIIVAGRNLPPNDCDKKIHCATVDFNDLLQVKELLKTYQPDIIINLIAQVTAERSLSLFPSMLETNLNPLLTLYEASTVCTSLRLVIQIGSLEEYGDIPVPFREEQREQPASPYALSKQLATNTAMMLHRNFNFPTVVLRLANLFGPHQASNKLIPYLVTQLLKNSDIALTSGEQKREFLYVDRLAEIIKSVIEQPDSFIGQILNLGSSVSYSIKEIALACKAYLNSSSNIVFGALPDRPNEMPDMRCSSNKFFQLSGHKIRDTFLSDLKNFLTTHSFTKETS